MQTNPSKTNIPDRNGDKSATTSEYQRETFAVYFSSLATRQNNSAFNDQLQEDSQLRGDLIKQISDNYPIKKILVCIEKKNLKNAFRNLNNGKSADEYDISTKHFKYSGF